MSARHLQHTIGQAQSRSLDSQRHDDGRRNSNPDCAVGRIPAGEIEAAVVDQLRLLLRSPEIIVETCRAAQKQDSGITEAEVRTLLTDFDEVWSELFPAEQARVVQLLVRRVDIGTEGADIQLRSEGLSSLLTDLGAAPSQEQNAA